MGVSILDALGDPMGVSLSGLGEGMRGDLGFGTLLLCLGVLGEDIWLGDLDLEGEDGELVGEGSARRMEEPCEDLDVDVWTSAWTLS